MAFIQGKGAKFNWHNGTSAVQVIQCEEITPAGGTNTAIRFKATDGSAGVVAGAGLPEFGQVQFTIAWDCDDTVHQGLYADFAAGTTRACNVTYGTLGSGAVYSWSTGVVTGWEPQGFTADDIQKIAVTIDVGGASISA